MQRNSALQQLYPVLHIHPRCPDLDETTFRVPAFGITARARPGRLATQVIVYFGGGCPSTSDGCPLNGPASATLHFCETPATGGGQLPLSYPPVPLVTKQRSLYTPRHASVTRFILSFAHWFTKQITLLLASTAAQFTLFKYVMAQYIFSGASHRQSSIRPFGSLATNFLMLLCIIPLVFSASIHLPAGHKLAHRGLHKNTRTVDISVEASVSATPSYGSNFWLAQMPQRGSATFNNNSASYVVRRNVKDYGAKGDGISDDTAAINNAIQDGGRCGNMTCESSTTQPALIYFPAGTYLVSSPIVAWYYSQLIGDPFNRPTIKGAAGFSGMALIDSDPYVEGGANWYTNQNNFFRSVRNFVIDTTGMPPAAGTGIHWQVAQATSLMNIHFELSQAEGNTHQGIFMDNGSGGFMSDLSFNGGYRCAFLGNQQFMTRNFTFTNCKTAIYMNWNWQWTFKSVAINNCGIGIEMDRIDNATRQQGVGSVVLLDSSISNTPFGINTARSASSLPISGGSLVLDNVQFTNVAHPVYNPMTSNNLLTCAEAGTTTIDFWGQGRDYSTNSNKAGVNVQGPLTRAIPKPAELLTNGGNTIFERSRPQYESVPVSNFVSIKDCGAKGDGVTDDTATLQRVFNQYANSGKIIFFDLGHYIVSNTVIVPTGTRIVGELWSVIMADGVAFQDVNNPKPVFQIGNPGDCGMVEISELLFETKGPQVGAILLEWNSRDPVGSQGVNAMWDVHFRVGGSAGTDLNPAQCIKTPDIHVTPDPKCYAAFMLMRIGKTANVYMENVWGWTSDHGIDFPHDQITIYNARGIYTESTDGPVWMYGVASEHNVFYQYQMQDTKNLFMAVGQTETPYFQPNPVVNVVHPINKAFNDPDYSTCTTDNCKKSWGLRVVGSSDIHVYGAGFYSFFQNYLTNCTMDNPQDCQDNIVSLEGSHKVSLLNLNTVGVINMVNVNGKAIAPSAYNQNGYAATVMRFDAI